MESKLNKLVKDLLNLIALSIAIVFAMAIVDSLLTNLKY
jgi:hypothetical protein